MNNFLKFASLSLFVLVGCNEASVPLGPAENAPTDQQLVGYWQVTNPEANELDEYLLILPFNETEYFVSMHKEASYPVDDAVHMRVFLTEVGPHKFANIQPLSIEREESYIIYQYTVDDAGILTLKHVDHDMDNIETSEALQAFVSDVVASNAFDESDVMTFRKVELD